MNSKYPNVTKALSRSAVVAVVAVFLIAMAGGCMTTSIRSGEAGVRYSQLGGTDLDYSYGEGLKIYPPWVTVIRYDVRVQEKLEVLEALSSNGLSIGMDISIRWNPDAASLPQLHTTYGVDYYRKLVQPELRSAVREIVGQFTPDELYSSRRAELQSLIFERVRTGAEVNFVNIQAVLIRDIRLPDQIRMAIENKLKEEQEAERYQFTIEKERLEAQRKEIEARGQAEYQRLITQSLTPAFLKYKGIEATQLLANSANSKTVIVGGGDTGLPLILGGN